MFCEKSANPQKICEMRNLSLCFTQLVWYLQRKRANFLRISDFSQNILTVPEDSRNAPLSPPSYRDLAQFRSRFRDRRNPTSRSRFAVLLRVFGRRNLLRDISPIFCGFRICRNGSLGFPKRAFCASQLPRFGPISVAFPRSPKSDFAEPFRRFVARFRPPFVLRDISPIFCGFRISRKTSLTVH